MNSNGLHQEIESERTQRGGESLKVRLWFVPHRIRVPTNVCVNCERNVPPFKMIATEVKGARLDKVWRRVHYLNFPYCKACVDDLVKGRLKLKGSFFRKKMPVEASPVMVYYYGKFLRKKKLEYIDFEFTNERYGRLFTEANQDLLFEKVLAEAEADLRRSKSKGR